MAKYFKGVFGSPRVKSDIVREDILQANGLSAEESVLIGDSVTDLKAAQDNGMRFIARVLDTTDAWFEDKDVIKKVKDLDGLFEYVSNMKAMAR
jgi:histidinol phosphatase-like enzyme